MAVGPTMRRIFQLIYDSTAKALKTRLMDSTGADVIGVVTASPTSNTVLDRLKTIATNITSLATSIVLAAGTAVIGKVRMVTALGDEVTNDTKDAVKTDEVITKTAVTIQAITEVAADVQSKAAEIDLSGQDKVLEVSIFHAKDHASASVGQGTEYVVQVSPKAFGDDSWVTKVSSTAVITAPTAMISDAEEAAGQTVIECGAATPVVGDILFFKNATIANSEWANVVARSNGVSVTLEDGLTNVQAQGTYYTQGERFNSQIDVRGALRLRVVCNNTKGTTNRAIVWQALGVRVV